MSVELSKDILDDILKDLGKNFKKLNGSKMPAEIIIVGGASVVANYNFRQSTQDIDAIMIASSALKDAARITGDKFCLDNNWLNSDFTKTASYSHKLMEHSKYYRTFSNVLTVRVVKDEYLIAMKLVSGRAYKKDLSDIYGILAEKSEENKPISIADIKAAVRELYGEDVKLTKMAQDLLSRLENENIDYVKEYENIKNEELKNKKILNAFEKVYPDVLSEENINEILNINEENFEKKDWQKEYETKEKTSDLQNEDYEIR